MANRPLVSLLLIQKGAEHLPLACLDLPGVDVDLLEAAMAKRFGAFRPSLECRKWWTFLENSHQAWMLTWYHLPTKYKS